MRLFQSLIGRKKKKKDREVSCKSSNSRPALPTLPLQQKNHDYRTVIVLVIKKRPSSINTDLFLV